VLIRARRNTASLRRYVQRVTSMSISPLRLKRISAGSEASWVVGEITPILLSCIPSIAPLSILLWKGGVMLIEWGISPLARVGGLVHVPSASIVVDSKSVREDVAHL
jgi:hypothetical protein